MALTPDLSIVIPAYNEESRITRTIRDMVSYCRSGERAFELILVDDGSKDGTGNALAACFCNSVRVILERHDRNPRRDEHRIR